MAKSWIRLSTAHNTQLLGSTKPELRRRPTHLSGALDEMAGRRGSSWGAGTPGLLSSMSCSTWCFHQGSPYCSQSSQRRAFQKEEIKTAGPLKCYSLTLPLPLLLTWLVLQATVLRTIRGMNTRRQGSLGTVFWALFPISLPFARGAKIVFFIFVIPVPCMNLTPGGHSLRPLNETVEVKLQN